MKRLAIIKGKSQDELRRNKEKARNTMNQIKNARTSETAQATSAAKTMKATATAAGGLGTSTMRALSAPEDSPINFLLFGNPRKTGYGGMTSSLGNTSASSASSASVSVIGPLKLIIKRAQLTKFNISASSQTQEKPINVKEAQDAKGGLETKIKLLLEQRKPPVEDMPSLCEMYDEDLNFIGS